MMDKIKKWVVDHPYFLTSAVFLVILFVGWRVLYWRQENFALMLLLYFIVTLGIRLDDISRKIGIRTSTTTNNPGSQESLMHQLNDIKHALLAINATLNRILEKTEEKDQ
jgi:cytochrome b561